MSATVVALHLSTKSRAPLTSVGRAEALAARGLEGDRHAERPRVRRQVLLMEREVLDRLGLQPGDVREQITVSGLDLNALPLGARLRIGTAVLEVGDPCAPCERMDEVRPGLQQTLNGRRGRFVQVLQAGSLAVGDPIAIESGAPARAEP